jgi:hypothetical protein
MLLSKDSTRPSSDAYTLCPVMVLASNQYIVFMHRSFASSAAKYTQWLKLHGSP